MDRLAAATCVVFVVFVSPCFAQSGTDGSSTYRAVQRSVDQSRPSLLVLNNGRVVGGIITPRPGGYDIRKAVGTLFIASVTVRFEAADMAAAYTKLRGTYNQFTPEAHIAIARWCIANKQIPAARRELLDALHLEPRNDAARLMLKRLEAAAAPKPKPTVTRTLAQRRMDRFMRSDHESLGGLTNKQAATFVSRVQRILESGCASSSCHGSASTTDFILKRMRGHSSRLVSERNLATVLKQVDFKQPANSPILRVLNEPHGRDGRPVLGTVQKKIILDWVRSVVTKDGTLPVEIPTVRFASARSVSPISERSTKPQAAVRQLTESEQELINEVRASNEEDPFDPAEFNRRHHGFQKTARNQPNR